VDGEDREYIRGVLSNIIDCEKDGEARRRKAMEEDELKGRFFRKGQAGGAFGVG